MKRIFSFVLLTLLAVTFTTAHAQQYILIWENNGALSIKSVTQVDSLTFVGDNFFDISTSKPISVATNIIHAKANIAWNKGVKSFPKTTELGVCFSSTNVTPAYADEHICLDSSDKNYGFFEDSYDFVLDNLNQKTTYYYRTYFKLGDEIFYGNVCSAKTVEEVKYTINGHNFVDLGLPSGLLWAESNMGANSATENGDYYAWGETEPKSTYSWDSYKWTEEFKYSDIDGKTTLETDDDAATVKWGTKCRMPSISDVEELKEKCDWISQLNYQGTSGYIVIGPNGNSLFLPDAGIIDNKYLIRGYGHYWTRNLVDSDDYESACYFTTYDFGMGYIDTYSRCCGLPIRPVAER